MLVWLDDDSEGWTETRAFLDRRIDDVMRFEKWKARMARQRERLLEPQPLPRPAALPAALSAAIAIDNQSQHAMRIGHAVAHAGLAGRSVAAPCCCR